MSIRVAEMQARMPTAANAMLMPFGSFFLLKNEKQMSAIPRPAPNASAIMKSGLTAAVPVVDIISMDDIPPFCDYLLSMMTVLAPLFQSTLYPAASAR